VVALIAPFGYGVLGVSLLAIYAVTVARAKGGVLEVGSVLLLSLLNDVLFQSFLGSTFLSLTLLIVLDFLFKRVIPHETKFVDFLITSICFVFYLGVSSGLASLYAQNPFVLFESWDMFLSALVIGLMMGVMTSLINFLISYTSGSSLDHKIIKL